MSTFISVQYYDAVGRVTKERQMDRPSETEREREREGGGGRDRETDRDRKSQRQLQRQRECMTTLVVFSTDSCFRSPDAPSCDSSNNTQRHSTFTHYYRHRQNAASGTAKPWIVQSLIRISGFCHWEGRSGIALATCHRH